MPNPTVVTGSASGLGAALMARLAAAGRPAIGVDVVDGPGVDILADLGTPAGRSHVIDEVGPRTDALDGLVSCAGVSPLHPDPAVVISVNAFGALAVLDGLRPLLKRGAHPAAVAIASIGAVDGTADESLLAVLEAGDEEAARAAAVDDTPYRSAIAYSTAKRAVAFGV
ncbi:MAG TPA: hypothetical protein PKA98_16625, partial [Acidimicrobiales bacterium]|nr:hypothetical protein [Acidimicrobiales bacterium]